MRKYFFRTIQGDIPIDHIGLTLPHEHIFTDLRGPDVDDYAQADPDLVASTMVHFLKLAEISGVTALIECSTIGVGRNIEILKRVAAQTRIHIVAPTGIYKEAFTPAIYKDSTAEELVNLWFIELTEGIGLSGCKAGFIKIALSDDGPTAIEVRNIRAAARTSIITGATIASHTIGGKAALIELSILEEEGINLENFVWVHASSEPDIKYHQDVAAKGAYIEFDSIGQPGTNQTQIVSNILGLIAAGFGNRILLSHDAGWFQPGNPGGVPESGIRGFNALTEKFIPLLHENGLDQNTVDLLTIENPKQAFAMQIII